MSDRSLDVVSLPRIDEHLHVIHCSTGLAKDFNEGVPPVSVITVLPVRSDVRKSFAAIMLAPELGVPTDQLKSRHSELEKELLKRFYAFVAERPNAMWMHSNMSSSAYGFEVIDRRATAYGLSPVGIADERKFDLYGHIVKRLYPDPYFGHPRQEMMFRFNFGNVPDLLTGEEAATAWANGNYTALVRSTERKVNCLAGLHAMLLRGETLKGNPRCLAGRELKRFADILSALDAPESAHDRTLVERLTDELDRHLSRAVAELARQHPQGAHRPDIDAAVRHAADLLAALKSDPSTNRAAALVQWCRSAIAPVAEELMNDGARPLCPPDEIVAAKAQESSADLSDPERQILQVLREARGQLLTIDQIGSRTPSRYDGSYLRRVLPKMKKRGLVAQGKGRRYILPS